MTKYGFVFRDWDVYKDGRKFRTKAKKITAEYPQHERYALVDQTNRALNSIILNIAESSNRRTDKEKRQFIIRSLGSLDEVVAALDCALDDGYISSETHDTMLGEADRLAKQLKGFIGYLSSDK